MILTCKAPFNTIIMIFSGTIGVNAAVTRYNCTSNLDPSTNTESIASWAQKAGKGTGIVTTTRVTHASPAGM